MFLRCQISETLGRQRVAFTLQMDIMENADRYSINIAYAIQNSVKWMNAIICAHTEIAFSIARAEII